MKRVVQLALDVFPDRVAVRLDDHAALDARIIHQLGLLTMSVYHLEKSTSIEVMSSTIFFFWFAKEINPFEVLCLL